ncbi:MAG: AAA family ATPase [Ardenticatenaceae bacterium]|nr:AAA family ATPase [Anaerolineales bacterium]MCB8938833.1 AAA family ATPase [Ardenticatenaceae bacterium]MCB8974069.1 AAA family ATPase [Ardenticatenaceae bacterium]
MAGRLEVRLLGGAAFLLNDQPVKSIPTRAAQALLIYLLHQRTSVDREQLIDLFFQASTPKQAAANLRSTLSRLRKELAPFLLIDGRTVGINPQADIWLDSAQFNQKLDKNERDSALELYRGDFLAGFFLRDAPEFENWALVERERLRLKAIEALKTQVTQLQEQATYWDALDAVNKLLGIESYLEEMHRTKMLLLMRTGQRARALQQYQTVVNLFADELGVAVLPQTVALYERINNLTTPPPHNLPVPTDQFIGREPEMRTILQLLADPSRRLITLFGIGGIGKTRLALEVARRLAKQQAGMFLDGTFFVSLIGVEAAATAVPFAQQVLQAIGVTASGRQAPTEEAIAHLRQREMLLILDNFEQLVTQNRDFLARLLTEAPHIKLLVTSRERLNLVEETVFDLAGLPLTGAEPLHSDAAQLFMTHAQRSQFTFAPTPADQPAILQTCHLLEGIPLGIELAAGSVRYASCAEIARQVAENLGSLSSPLHNVPARHRSLRAMFLYSWELLPEPLRPIFANLTVFPAAFDAAAAQSVVGATEAQLNRLVDTALLKLADGRFQIHPLLKTFAAEQRDAAEELTLYGRHASYFAQFITESSQTYHRPTYLQSLPALVTAYDDLVAAWRWSIAHLVATQSQPVWAWVMAMRRPFVRLHFQKNRFYAIRDLMAEACRQLEDAGWHLPEAATQQRLLHAQLTVAEGNSARILGDYDGVVDRIQQTIPLLRQHVALDDLFDAYNALVGTNMQQGKLEDVPEMLNELEAIAFELQKPVLFGVLYVSRSYHTDFLGDPEGALAYAQQALDAFAQIEDTYYEAIVLSGIAQRLFTLKRPEEAAKALHRAAKLANQNQIPLTEAFAQKWLAHYHQNKGELAEAEAALTLSKELFLKVNEQRNLVEIDYSFALLAQTREQWPKMARHLVASLQRAQTQKMQTHIMDVLVRLPSLQWRRGEREIALAWVSLLQQESLNAAQQAVLKEAVVEMETAVSIPKTPHLTLDDLAATFLREGLRWFAPNNLEIS